MTIGAKSLNPAQSLAYPTAKFIASTYDYLRSSPLLCSVPLLSRGTEAMATCSSTVAIGHLFHRSHAFNVLEENNNVLIIKASLISTKRNLLAVLKATAGNNAISPTDDDEGGVSLGTLKLPGDTDLARFETLLFQVDKIPGGARIGFITVGDGETEVPVYIDCLAFPPTDTAGPIFWAIRNGLRKAGVPPGEPRIMRSLIGALKISVEIARV